MDNIYQLSEEQLIHAQSVLIDKMVRGTASDDERVAYQQIAARRSALLYPAPRAGRAAPRVIRTTDDLAFEAQLAQTQQHLVDKLVQGTASLEDRAALAATTAHRATLLYPARVSPARRRLS